MPIRLKLSRRGKPTSRLRKDSITPTGNSEHPKKFELPPTHPKETRKAPGKKNRSAVKKEKPRPVATKVQGAVLWHDCPVEIISSAKANVISGAIPVLVDVVASVKVPPSMNSSDVPSEKSQPRRTNNKRKTK